MVLDFAKSLVKKPAPDQIENINDQLFFDMPSVKTDCALLLGARSASGEIARKAADLYKQGKFKKIVISGGLPVKQLSTIFAAAVDKKITVPSHEAKDPRTEAEFMKAILLQNGVQAEDIIFIDNTSTNTGENIQNCKEILDIIGSITIVSLAYHQRRALGTLRKTLSTSPVVTTAAVYPFGITKNNWADTKLSFVVEDEMKKLSPQNPKNYITKGFCLPVDLERETKYVNNLIRATTRKPRTPN